MFFAVPLPLSYFRKYRILHRAVIIVVVSTCVGKYRRRYRVISGVDTRRFFFRFFFLPTGVFEKASRTAAAAGGFYGYLSKRFVRGLDTRRIFPGSSPGWVCSGCAIALRLRILRNHPRTRVSPSPPRHPLSNRTSRCASHPLLFEEGISQSNTFDARRAQANPRTISVLTVETALRKSPPTVTSGDQKTISRPKSHQSARSRRTRRCKINIISFYVSFEIFTTRLRAIVEQFTFSQILLARIF